MTVSRRKYIIQRELPPHPLVNSPTWLDVEEICSSEYNVQDAQAALDWRRKNFPENHYRLVRIVEK